MKLKNRNRWKFLIVITAVLVVGMVAIGALVRQAQKRTVFLSEVDPMTGYRYRITLSADWKKEEEDTTFASSAFSTSSFVESQGSPVPQWIQRHLWRRKTTEPLKINLASYPLTFLPKDGGYPELTPETGSRVIMQRQLHIDGCAATLMAVDSPIDTQYREHLVVYVPASTTMYSVVGISEPSGAVRLDHEMQGVIASFHTEKVPVSRTDLEVIETALSDWQTVHGLEHKEAGDDEVVVYNKCFENFKPQNHKLVLSDMKAFLLAMSRYAPNYSTLYDDYLVSRPPWKKFYPHAFAHIYTGRPTYPNTDTAVLELRCAESSGETKNRYTLKRKQGKWSIVQRNNPRPE